MAEIVFETGVQEFKVNGGRNIRFNPVDSGFAETLYSLIAKVTDIDDERRKRTEKNQDYAKIFDYNRAADNRMREAVDSVFGENFCKDVFGDIRLTAIADGLSVVENFLLAVLDQMDESVTENLAKRDARIAKYTAKFAKYKK